jgi:hypothetical protein
MLSTETTIRTIDEGCPTVKHTSMKLSVRAFWSGQLLASLATRSARRFDVLSGLSQRQRAATGMTNMNRTPFSGLLQ